MKRHIKHILSAVALLLSASSAVRADEPISLAGEWRFEIAAKNTESCPAELTQKIRLPGTIDDARLGPPNTKAPTLEGPWRLSDYAGPAWYQRDIEIPTAWAGQRLTLFLERCRWVTTAWLDDKRISSQDSLISPHVHDFGTGVTPGKHRLTICVDNTDKIQLGQFVSAMRGGTWGNMNGIVGRIELNATPTVWVDEVNVYPNAKRKIALVKIRVGNATGKPGTGILDVGTMKCPVSWNEQGGNAELEVSLPDAALWDEFSPKMQNMTVRLGDHQKTVRFGLRDFGTMETQFTMNGRPLFLRGTLECSVWPLTGYPPTDVDAWRKIYRVIQSYGLNHMRFHSWCPPEAAFIAADEEGVILQVEGPFANLPVGKNTVSDAFLEAEYRRIVDTYGNHPSFCLMALGNEFGGDMKTLTRWVEMLRERDPRHLYTSASNNHQEAPNRQFTVKVDGRGIKGPGTARDLTEIVKGDPHPVVAHEIGQWMYWPDSREIPKWNGVMTLKNYEWVRDDLARKHLADLEPRYVEACGRLATLLYKEEIEVLLRTPKYGGVQLLDLHDYPTQGTALVGPLNAFWESKGFITPEGYRRFCSATVPLLRMPKRTYTNTESFEATSQLAHYGAEDLANTQPFWKITDAQGKNIATGKLPALTAPTGKVTDLGPIKASLADIKSPGKFTVTVSLEGTRFINDWEIWVYPAAPAPTPPADVVISKTWNEAKTELAAGKKVVFFPGVTNPAHSMAGSYLPVFWSPVWFPKQKPNTMGLLCDPKHPLFAQFPTEMHTNWQWYDLMQHSRLFILDETPADYRPLVQVIDNFARNHKLGIVFETRAGSGRLLVCGFDLLNPKGDSATRQFLTSLYSYVSSANFNPTTEIKSGTLDAIFAAPPEMKTEPKR